MRHEDFSDRNGRFEHGVTSDRTSPARVAELHCAEVWRALVDGELLVVDTFAEERSDGLIMRFATSTRPPFPARNLEMFERFLAGTSGKVLALEQDLAESTVAQILKSMLRAMGFGCSPGRVSPLLVLLAHEARSARPGGRLQLARVSRDGTEYLSLKANLASSALDSLAPAERAVMRERVLGRSLADIAAERRTSERTVANQIAHAYCRLGISGRHDLLQLVAFRPGP